MNPVRNISPNRKHKISNGTNIAVFCSGQGTNLQAIIDAVKSKRIKANLSLVVCDVPKAYAIRRAKKAHIEVAIVDPKEFPTTEKLEGEIVRHLKRKKIGLIALAGFMRVLSPRFVRRYKNRILNIHPALLPAFRGAHAIKDVLRYGVKISGPTVHFVTEVVDSGPIILQAACPVRDDDTGKSLLARVHKLEHKIYPKAIQLCVEGKLKVVGSKVKILLGLLFIMWTSALVGVPLVYAEEKEFIINDVHIPVSITYENGEFQDGPQKSLVNYNYTYRPDDSDYRPLTREEFSERRLSLYFQAVSTTAELLDSLYMPFMAEGLFEIIGYGYKLKGYKDLIETKYNLHLEVGKSDAFITYKRRY